MDKNTKKKPEVIRETAERYQINAEMARQKLASMASTGEGSREVCAEQETLKEPMRDAELGEHKGMLHIYIGHPKYPILSCGTSGS